jgi:hypothetical protein
MSTIDQVIARSRQPGGFKERKRFTVARQRAIRKMREFALADPHYYVLELIQAAVANEATYVDLRCEKRSFGMSYIGGGFSQEELAQLFDFLFASKKDFAHGDIRQLALGINALMIMEPTRIIIESGNGTMGGTTRIEINSGQNTVDVGTPDKALRGTFVRAEGLNRSKMRGKSNLDPIRYGPAECMAIENRCLAAPVPLLVNDYPVFGYSSVRTPAIFGYQNVVTFDEGDLYGSIGIAQQAHNEMFKLLTWGTWIQSLEHELITGGQVGSKKFAGKFGGVVAYNRLNKTADHSGIVKDDRLAQMWARLKPYAYKSLRGDTGRAVFQIAPLGGGFLEPRRLREMLHDHGTAVVVPPMLSVEGPQGQRATEIGRVLDAPVLTADAQEMATLRNLAGPGVRLLRPDLDNPDELAFFKKKTAQEPERPWIIGSMALSPLAVHDFVELLVAEEIVSPSPDNVDELRERLGSNGELSGTIFTPVDQASAGHSRSRELWVRVRTVDRVVWQGAVTSAYPGHVLDIDVPAVSPSALLSPAGDGVDASLARLIAEVMARHAVDDLESCATRALESLAQIDIEPGSTGARVGLAALARGAVTRLRSIGTDASKIGPSVRFSLVDARSSLDLLDVPVFRTLEGAALTMRDLAGLMETTHGLVYGVVPEVEPDLQGLDPSKILDLDFETERLLMQIVGEGAYIRVDKRDVLAEVEAGGVATGGVQIRDVALGLREYSDLDLLAEGRDAPIEESSVESLVEQLKLLFGWANRGGKPGDSDEAEELRRQSVRHLQYFVCRRVLARRDQNGADQNGADRPTYGVEKMGLFLDGRGRAISIEDIEWGFETYGRMVMVDGRSSDVCELGSLAPARQISAENAPRSLMMNTWVFGLIEPLGELSGAFDFDLSDAEAADVELTPESAFVASFAVQGDQLSGRVGLPEEPVDNPSIAVVSSDNQRVYQLRQPAIDFGVVGLIRVESGNVETRWKQVYSAATHAARQTLLALIDRLAEMQADEQKSEGYERVLTILFGFASRHLRLVGRPDGTIIFEINDPLAQRIFDVPVFATIRGVPISAQRLINEFCAEQARSRALQDSSRVALTDDVPEVLVDWVARHLRLENVARPAAQPAKPPADPQDVARPDDIAKALQRWIGKLRPDDHAARMTKNYAEAGGQPESWVQGPFELQVLAVDMTDEQAVLSLPSDEVCHLVAESDEEAPFCYTTGRPPVLVINLAHWLVRQAIDDKTSDNKQNKQGDPQAFAWLLLAAYSYINALLGPVTNDHELDFQLRVGQALKHGEFVL